MISKDNFKEMVTSINSYIESLEVEAENNLVLSPFAFASLSNF